jgi:NAD(P)-dependent dehydrogenase (short-subunit alcohol dehydrogenase family)
MGRLDGKVAIVTGAGRGTGKAFAIGLAKEGAKVVGTVNKRIEELDETINEIKKMGGLALAVKADVTVISDLDAMVKQSTDKFGKIDILVNNAVIYKSAPFFQKTEEDFDRVVAVNLKGTFFSCQRVAKDMAARGVKGSIINISANQAILGVNVMQSDYTATKGGVNALTRALAAELAQYGIRVNTVAYGLTLTEGVKELGAEVVKHLEGMASSIFPLKRVGVPADYVGLVNWLASDESSYCTASTFNVDGGIHAIQLSIPH